MENENKSSVFKGTMITIMLLLLACVGLNTYKYVTGNNIPNITQSSVNEEVSTVETVPTVEEAMIEWQDLKEHDRCYEIYMNFPPEIMQALFEKLGTQENIRKYVYEYERNREYYVSLQIVNQLNKTGLEDPGIDGKRIKKAKVQVELEKSTPSNAPIKAEPADSIQ